MTFLGKIWRLFSWFRGRRAFERNLEAELQAHIELRTEKYVRAGMEPGEARYAARLGFGGMDQLKERARDQRGDAWIGNLLQDLRFGARLLRRNRTFTAVAVVSLALGIGAATSVFFLFDAILLGSLPVPNPQDLRVICWSGSETHYNEYGTSFAEPDLKGRQVRTSFSQDAFLALRDRCSAEADLFCYTSFWGTARARGEAVGVSGFLVSGNFFSALEVTPLLGSLLSMRDEGSDGMRDIVISHHLWEQRFGLDPNVVGQPLTLGKTSFTVVGVLPASFAGIVPGNAPDVYVSMAAATLVMAHKQPSSPDFWWLALMGRLKAHVTTAQLNARLDVAIHSAAGKFITDPTTVVFDGRDGPVWDRLQYRTELCLLFGLVGVLLVVVCANVAGLLLARGAGRRHEFSVRAALGATRKRLFWQLLTESMILALAGGGLGVLSAFWGRVAISRLLAGSSGGLSFDPRLDPKVMVFALGVTVLTTVIAGLFPAWSVGSREGRHGTHGPAGLGLPRIGIGPYLVIGQLALSLLLVFAAGLGVRTLVNLVRINPGFPIDHLIAVELNPGDAGYPEAKTAAYFENVQRAFAAIPGVRSVGLESNALLWGALDFQSFEVEGRPRSDKPLGANLLTVGDGFFETIGIPMLIGRPLRAGDTSGAPKAIVVNEALARDFFAGEAPVGRSIKLGEASWTIVGVCADAKYNDIKQPVGPTLYLPFRQHPVRSASIALRTWGPPTDIIVEARKVARTINPNVVMSWAATEEQMRDRNITSERMFAAFCGSVAILAVLLASVGLYGLVSYEVSRRTTEFGIRMAIGANGRQILIPLLRKALLLAAAGFACGIPLTLVLARFVRAYLYGVSPYNPATLLLAMAVIAGVVALASWLPARRATRVDPMIALRCE